MRKYRRNSIAQAQLVRRYSKDCIDTRFDEIAKGREVKHITQYAEYFSHK